MVSLCSLLLPKLIWFFLMIILNAVPQYINLSSDKGSLKEDGFSVRKRTHTERKAMHDMRK